MSVPARALAGGRPRGNSIRRRWIPDWPTIVLTLPLLISLILGAADHPVEARDDDNYKAELDDRGIFELTIDPASWVLLSAVSHLAGVSNNALRLCGLLVVLATMVVLRRHCKEPRMTMWFLASILPVYLNVYFNQLRVAIALLIFVTVLALCRRRLLAASLAALGHSSFLLLTVPLTVLMVPFIDQVIGAIDPDALGAIRLLAYASSSETEAQWYFGWELSVVCILLLGVRQPLLALEVAAMAWASRTLAMDFNVDVGRRILELGLIAYSPGLLFLWRAVRPAVSQIVFFVALGLLQVVIALRAGVVSIT